MRLTTSQLREVGPQLPTRLTWCSVALREVRRLVPGLHELPDGRVVEVRVADHGAGLGARDMYWAGLRGEAILAAWEKVNQTCREERDRTQACEELQALRAAAIAKALTLPDEYVAASRECHDGPLSWMELEEGLYTVPCREASDYSLACSGGPWGLQRALLVLARFPDTGKAWAFGCLEKAARIVDEVAG